MSSGMKRNCRYWLLDMEEIFATMLLSAAAIELVFGILGQGRGVVPYSGMLLMLTTMLWLMAYYTQIRQLLSITVMMSSSRRESLRALQLSLLLLLVQSEAAQLVLWLLLPDMGNIQRFAVFYTPVLFLVAVGCAYVLSGLSVDHERLQKAFMPIICFAFGMTGSFLVSSEGAVLDLFSDNITQLRSGVFLASVLVSVLICAGGSVYMRKKMARADVRA